MLVLVVASVAGIPNFIRESIIGSTSPCKFIIPIIKEGISGTFGQFGIFNNAVNILHIGCKSLTTNFKC